VEEKKGERKGRTVARELIQCEGEKGRKDKRN
jgi:hypothetical protein